MFVYKSKRYLSTISITAVNFRGLYRHTYYRCKPKFELVTYTT